MIMYKKIKSHFRGPQFLLAFLALALSPLQAEIHVDKTVLDNGLKILFYQNSQAPTIACRLFFTTGSVHERPGNTGVAHMLEHMLFKGTNKVGVTDSVLDAKYISAIDSLFELKEAARRQSDSVQQKQYQSLMDSLLTEQRKLFIKDELWSAYLKAGGTGLNAFTSDLMTAYFVTLPKNKLELFLWLEADRMQHAVLREFYPERDVVMEERRMRYEDSPLGRYWESLYGMIYEAHPFRLPTIGYMSDISRYTRKLAEDHYRDYYKPNNAILVLAGDFEKAPTLALIKKYFANIPKGKELGEVVTREPEQVGEKRLTVRKNDAKPRLDFFFLTPPIPEPDVYALDILEGAFSGKSGRLYRRLVTKEKIALSAGAGNRVDKYHSTFHIGVELGSDPQSDSVETVVWDELNRLKTELLSERELSRVKNQVTARNLRKLQDMEHMATELAFLEMWGTWEFVNLFPQRVQAVTAEQVQEVVKKYFHKKRATVGVVLPDPDKKKTVGKGDGDV